MNINTKFFGQVEIEEAGIIEFVQPILAFEEMKKFVLLEGMEDLVFTFLQSIEDANLCFLVIPPSMIVEEYDIEISTELVDLLELTSPVDALLYNIVSVPENVENLTVNLKAPIIINLKNKKAAQEILANDKYSIKHKVSKAGE